MENPRIIFRTEGGHKIGLGHVQRCLRLADQLKKRFHSKNYFLLSTFDHSLKKLFHEEHHEVCSLENSDENIFLGSYFSEKPPHIWVTDIRTEKRKSFIQGLAGKFGFLHILIDDMHLSGIEADITINPSVVPCDKNTHAFPGRQHYCGSEYFFHFPSSPAPGSSGGKGKRILISMGGSDPGGITEKILISFSEFSEDVEVHLVIGPAFQRHIDATDFPVTLHRSPKNLTDLLSGADLAITSGGLTLYEAVLSGVPVISVPQHEHELKTVLAFEKKGVAINMGIGRSLIDPGRVAAQAASLLGEPERLRQMSLNCKNVPPGRGVETVMKIISGKLSGYSLI